jgi:hypothetical protein
MKMEATEMAETIEAIESPRSEWSAMPEEDRTAAVAAMAKEIEAESAAKPPEDTKPEPTKTPDTKTPVPGDDTPAADDAAKVEKEAKGEVEGEEADAEDWTESLDQNSRDYFKTMGVSDEMLSEFDSREDLDRHLRIFNRQAYEKGKTASTQESGQPAPEPKAVAQPKVEATPPPTATSGDPFADLSQFKLGEEVDEEAFKPFSRFVEAAVARDRQKTAEIGDLKNGVAEIFRFFTAQQIATIQQIGLGHLQAFNPTRYGKPGEGLTKEQAANIEKVLHSKTGTHFVHAKGLDASGIKPEPSLELLKAADHLAFGEQNLKQERKRITDKLRKQSRTVQYAGTGAPMPASPVDVLVQKSLRKFDELASG